MASATVPANLNIDPTRFRVRTKGKRAATVAKLTHGVIQRSLPTLAKRRVLTASQTSRLVPRSNPEIHRSTLEALLLLLLLQDACMHNTWIT
jgi:hypothetical protein